MAVDMYSNILEGEEYSFVKTNEHLGKHAILLGLAGSFSYGTNIETSDIDLRDVRNARRLNPGNIGDYLNRD